jgi:hypothetical protein
LFIKIEIVPMVLLMLLKLIALCLLHCFHQLISVEVLCFRIYTYNMCVCSSKVLKLVASFFSVFQTVYIMPFQQKTFDFTFF